MNVYSLNVDFSEFELVDSNIKLKQFQIGADVLKFLILKGGNGWDFTKEYSEALIRFVRSDGGFSEKYLWKKDDANYDSLNISALEDGSFSVELSYSIDLFEVFRPGNLELQLIFLAYDEEGEIDKKPFSPVIKFEVVKSISGSILTKQTADLIDSILGEIKLLQSTVTSDEYVAKLEKCIADIAEIFATVIQHDVLLEENKGELIYDKTSEKAQSGIAVAQAIASIVNSAPETLNTLEELANALGDDPNFATTIMTLLGGKVDTGIFNITIGELQEDSVIHKSNMQNPHRVTKDQVGLGNVDNTSDMDKPISDAAAREFERLEDEYSQFSAELNGVVYPAIDNKVDKEDGKGLSTNDFTDDYKMQIEDNSYLIGRTDNLLTDNTDNLVDALNETYDIAVELSNVKADKTELDNKVDKVNGYGLIYIDDYIDEWLRSIPGVYKLSFAGIDTPAAHEGVYIGSIDYVKKLINPTPITTIPTTLTASQKYNFGEVAELSLAFPTTSNDGDVIFLTFMSGATATALTIDTTNTSDIEVIPEANTGYEIFGCYNGEIWIVNYSEYTVSEG